MEMMRKVASSQGIGLRGVAVRERSPTVLGTPWIAHLSGVVGHYVVVERVTATWVTFVDPALGRRVMEINEFRLRWSGDALIVSIGNGVAN
jgi:ABC-type bacteriocin/lantibiotic exporter with double-glycine peptidase domain